MSHVLQRIFPILTWLRTYTNKDLKGDLVAGITTAVMLIPQGMAYAMLAGLPPIHGLYASILPLIVYAIFGTSRQLAVGPAAMDSLLVATGVGAIAQVGSDAFIAYAILLAFMVGAIQLLMGLVRLGFLVNFLSQPIILGFTSAAALIIASSQLKHLLGIHIPRSASLHVILKYVFMHLHDIQPITLILGTSTIITLVVLKRFWPRAPRAIIVVLLGTLAVYFGELHTLGVDIVHEIPAGLPAFGLPAFDQGAMRTLAPIAWTIALVGFMESIAVSKALATQHGYEINANQELIALGLSNIGGSLTQGYPITGGLSRSAVNASAGAKTALASMFTAGVVITALLFLTPLLYYLPKAVLAAIIMVAVFGLIDLSALARLWRVKKSDLTLLVITWVATLTFGIQQGLSAGIGISLFWFVVRTTRPHFAVLGRIPDTNAYRNLKNHPNAEQIEGTLLVRMDAQFYFGNISFLREQLTELTTKAGQGLHTIVIDASAMNQLDSSAAHALHEIATQLEAQGLSLLLANIKRPVLDVLERDAYFEHHARDTLFLTVHDAVLSLDSEHSKVRGVFEKQETKSKSI